MKGKQYVIMQNKNGEQSPGSVLYNAYDQAQQVADKLNTKQQPGVTYWVAEAEVKIKGNKR
ncbi:hypothetical protein PZC41_14925 [Staphylococcus aureus]|uniref:hypothetical protein n=1 Tax=Staphylococcus aureus TaxID=1280 RepID=UPI0023AFE73F|nr:hypothetical protein [Staphylococcus aureus]MDE8535592.1 hypothetical protein [Staphylococcus aureus]